MKNRKKPLIVLVLFACEALLCSCSVKSKGALVSYARNEYGACKFVKQETMGTGNDKVRKVYLIDKDTGIEYIVTSGLNDINIDGSSFGHVENTRSDFMDLYIEYVRKNAREKLESLENKYNVQITDQHQILFASRPSTGQPKAVAEEVKDVIDSYDEKGLLGNIPYLVYSEDGDAYLGELNSATGQWSGEDPYAVIDYVQSVFPEAKYSSYIYGIPESYVDYDDMQRLIGMGCKNEDVFDTKFYFFKDPKYGTLVAFDLTKIGLDGFIITEYLYSIPGRTLDCDALGIHVRK